MLAVHARDHHWVTWQTVRSALGLEEAVAHTVSETTALEVSLDRTYLNIDDRCGVPLAERRWLLPVGGSFTFGRFSESSARQADLRPAPSQRTSTSRSTAAAARPTPCPVYSARCNLHPQSRQPALSLRQPGLSTSSPLTPRRRYKVMAEIATK